MIQEEALKQRRKAAQAAILRIRKDSKRASGKILEILEYMEPRLFDPDLDVNSIRRACEIRDNSISLKFGRILGKAPKAYIEDRRMETAAALLRKSSLKVSDLAEALGYSSLDAFSKAFRRWSGERPTAFRQRLAEEGPRGETPVRDLEGFWSELLSESPEGRRSMVHREAPTPRRDLFEFLSRKSREEGRRDRQLGVELANLALDSLYTLENSPQPCRGLEAYLAAGPDLEMRDLLELKSRAWMGLANARRLHLEFACADRALDSAAWYLEGSENRLLVAELHLIRATLRWYESRLSEAKGQVRQAREILKRLGHGVMLARALVIRADIEDSAGNLNAAILDLKEAAATLGNDSRDPRLAFAIPYNLAAFYCHAGRFEEARQLLPQILDQASTLGQDADHEEHLAWLEGSVLEGIGQLDFATEKLAQAREGFLRKGQLNHASVLSLDLAMLHVRRGELREALALAVEIVPLLRALQHRTAYGAALALLQSTLASGKPNWEVLRHVKAQVQEVRRNPALRASLGLEMGTPGQPPLVS